METLDLSLLAADGDTLELADGTMLRLRIEADCDTSITDFDCYGTFAWVERHPYRVGDAQRPRGFDGQARKLRVSRGHDAIWWQPHPDVPADRIDAERELVVRLLEDGYVGVIVERCSGTDAYGRPVVIDVASVWGIEACATEGHLADVVGELVREVC